MLEKTLSILDAAFEANHERFSEDMIRAIERQEATLNLIGEGTMETMDGMVQRVLNLSNFVCDDDIAASLVIAETLCLAGDDGSVAAEVLVEMIRPICGLSEAQLSRSVSRFVSPTGKLLTSESLASLLLELKRKTAFSCPGMLRAVFEKCYEKREARRHTAERRLRELATQNEELLEARRALFEERMSQLASAEATIVQHQKQELKHFFSRRVRVPDPQSEQNETRPVKAEPVDVQFIVEQLLRPNCSR